MTLILCLTLSLVTSRWSAAQTAAPAPIIYQGVVDYNKALADQATRAKKAREKQRQEAQQTQSQMQQMMSALNGGGAQGGKNGKGRKGQTGGGDTTTAVSDSAQNTSSGRLEPCGTVPATVQHDLQDMMEFRKSCTAANKGADQKFAINEYRNSLGQPTMYLFDANGDCKYKTAVAYGSGQARGTSASPQTCATKEGHFTPAGMHLTVPHPSGSNGYNASNSLGLAGLEGQGSNGRGILIHGSNSAGMGYTYGCSGVDKGCISDVMSFLGYGALVYNSFDDAQAAPGCTNTAGLKRTGTCQAEVAVNASPASPSGGGGSSGATR